MSSWNARARLVLPPLDGPLRPVQGRAVKRQAGLTANFAGCYAERQVGPSKVAGPVVAFNRVHPLLSGAAPGKVVHSMSQTRPDSKRAPRLSRRRLLLST